MGMTNTKNAAKAALVTAAMSFAAGSVEAETPYVFMAIDTATHGADVVDGRYDEAITRIRGTGKADFDFNESTNLCIAYAKSGDSQNALRNCNRAVDIARVGNGLPRWSSSRFVPSALRAKDIDLVIALSNRSVVHAANGEYTLAFEDLNEANELRPQLHAVSLNLELLAEATTR